MKPVLFTYLLAYGGSLVALYDPFVGLLVYVCFAILRPEFLWFYAIEPGHNFSRVIAVALLAGWALQAVLHGERMFVVGRARAVIVALVAAWGWALLSAALAPNPEVTYGFLEYFTKTLLPFVVGISLIDSMARVRALAWVIVLSQGYVALEMNLAYFGGYNRIYLDGFADMDNNCASIAMVTCVGPAFFLGVYADRWWQKGVAFACAALLGHAVLLSFSRGGMLALVLTGVAAVLLMRPSPRGYLALLGAGLVGLRLAGPEVRERFMTLFARPEARDPSAQSRLQLWTAMCDVIQRQPLLGAGPDHWPLLAESYGFSAGKEGHSLWLQWGAEMGLPGLAFLLLFYGVCVWRLWALARASGPQTDPWQRGLASMVIAALVGFAVSAQFVSLKLLEVPYYVALVGAGLLKLATPTPDRDRVPEKMQALPWSV